MNSKKIVIKIPITQGYSQADNFFKYHFNNLARAKQVYLKTLAVYAVDCYLKKFGIKTDLENSSSWNPVIQTLDDVADLMIQGVGRLECRPVFADSNICQIPEQALSDRVGYIAVKFNRNLTEATLLGFRFKIDEQNLLISQLKPIETLLHFLIQQQSQLFFPSVNFSERAYITNYYNYQKLCAKAEIIPEKFWGELAEKELYWFEKWEKVLEWEPPYAQWFVGGKLNISYNCLDRHLTNAHQDKMALIWEGKQGNKTLTYSELLKEVCQFANVLQQLGVKKGDRVGIYLPMIPEAIIAMLACARIGAIHTVIYSGFSAEVLRNRLNDAQVKLLISADGGCFKQQIVPLKTKVDNALKQVSSVEKVLIIKHTNEIIPMQSGRDYWWHELQPQVSNHCLAQPMDSEDPLFILYTSGTTGNPKGIVHTTGGYNLQTHISTKWVFDLKEEDVYWCTADIGWITGHSYVVYGPLSNGATIFIHEEDSCFSDLNYFWDLIQKHKISIFYTTPTVIRTLKKSGENSLENLNSSSLRLLGTVGEPIDANTWDWYHKVIGKEKCPIVDTWWQTETGGIMIAHLPGVTPSKRGSVAFPFPGIMADIVDKEGNSVSTNTEGDLVIKAPWPGMMRAVYHDTEGLYQRYWESIFDENGEHCYYTGDKAYRDAGGYFWITGRTADVIKVAGHPIGAIEIEFALMSHPAVFEAAVVGCLKEGCTEEIHAFVVLNQIVNESEDLIQELKKYTLEKIGGIASLKTIRFVKFFPQTHSSKKIMRSILRDFVLGKQIESDLFAHADSTTISEYIAISNDS